MTIHADVILVGAGLANGLIAHRLKARACGLRVVAVDERRPGEGRTWSYHETDLSPGQREWMGPLTSCRWPAQEVRFPSFSRRLETGYASVSGEAFGRSVEALLGDDLLRDEVVEVAAHRVSTRAGVDLKAPLVVDGRGMRADAPFRCAWQKFVGVEIELSTDCVLDAPIIMDATLPQRDGYRFLYTLPFERRRILVEDTYYSDSPALNVERLRNEALRYAISHGWNVERVARVETGVLPIPLAGDIGAFWNEPAVAPARSGVNAALFHMTTGYSLPEAVRLAERIANEDVLTTERIAPAVRRRSLKRWREQRFYRLLNRMLFLAGEPAERWRIMERFYRLPSGAIDRFYAGRTSVPDMVRILSGRPPVPVRRALRCLSESSVASVPHLEKRA